MFIRSSALAAGSFFASDFGQIVPWWVYVIPVFIVVGLITLIVVGIRFSKDRPPDRE
jgi:hypothetical protein